MSHNQLTSLSGIEFFGNLTHLSLQFNKLASIDEFSKICNPKKIEFLAVQGNSMVERNPDYKSLLIEYFPNLRELDQVNLQQIKQQIKIGKQLKRLIIPFMYRIDKVVQNLAHKIDSFSDEHPQEQRNKLILLRDEFDIIFQLKDFN